VIDDECTVRVTAVNNVSSIDHFFNLRTSRELSRRLHTEVNQLEDHRRNLRGVRGVRVPPTFWSGGYRTPHFLACDRKKITATFPHPALT